MKTLLVLAALTLSPALAYADPLAIAAFSGDGAVKSQLANAVANDLEVSGAPEAAFLSGICGFAGCSSSFLVTQAISTKGSNTRTSVVAAIVRMETFGKPTVTVTDIEKLLQ